jgi:hypothetical protein
MLPKARHHITPRLSDVKNERLIPHHVDKMAQCIGSFFLQNQLNSNRLHNRIVAWLKNLEMWTKT